jgi:hypothetical protein
VQGPAAVVAAVVGGEDTIFVTGASNVVHMILLSTGMCLVCAPFTIPPSCRRDARRSLPVVFVRA